MKKETEKKQKSNFLFILFLKESSWKFCEIKDWQYSEEQICLIVL